MSSNSVILVVDDTKENLQVLGEILECEGYEVRVTTDSSQVLNTVKQFPPDLILLDIMMPIMDGHEVCRQLKADPQVAGIPVIFISALGSQDEKLQGFSEGAVDYVTKPFQAAEVLARVKTHLKLVQMDELTEEIEKRKHSQEKLVHTLKEKESLIRELFHRTNNTLQVVRSLLVLQSSRYQTQEVRDLVSTTERRINAISQVHQLLLRKKNLSQIPMAEYFDTLVTDLLEKACLPMDKIHVENKIEQVTLLLDSAVPLGLILNELLTNSIQWAFPGDLRGTIKIELYLKDKNHYIFTFHDNGIGLPLDFNYKNQKALGLKLVHNLGEGQMSGNVKLSGEKGFHFHLEFQSDLYGARV